MRARLVLLCVGLLLAVVGGVVFFRARDDRQEVTSQAGYVDAQRALALTENMEAEEAQPIWEGLALENPDDLELKQNVAVNAVLDYAERVRLIQSMNLPKEEETALRQSLSEVFDRSERAIQSLKSADPQGLPAYWMSAELKRQRARLLPDVVAEGIQREVAQELLAAISQQPAPELLGMLLEIDEASPQNDLQPQILAAVQAVAKSNPRNLGAAAERAKREVAQHADSAAASIADFAKLCEPVSQEMERSLGGPWKEFMAKVEKDVAAKDWEATENSVLSWVYLLTSTQAWRTDLRRLYPNVLDFLSLRPVHRLMARDAKPRSDSTGAPTFTPLDLELADANQEKVRTLLMVDIDLDGQDELVALAGEMLQVWKLGDGRAELFASAPCSADAAILEWADLFIVDSGSPDRMKVSAAGLSGDAAQKLSVSHDTYPSLLFAGPQGISVLRYLPQGASPAERLAPPAKETGLEGVRGVHALSRADIEGDGDLDLILATDQSIEIWVNRGNMIFYPLTSHSQMPPTDSPIVSMAMGDLDRDLDVDFVTLQANGVVGYLENLLHQQFRWTPLEWPRLSNPAAIAIGDFDGDVSWDVMTLSKEGVVWSQTKTPASGAWRIEGTRQIAQSGVGWALADFNFDGWQDVALSDSAGVSLLRGMASKESGPRSLAFDDASKGLLTEGVTKLGVSDANRDGRLDIACALGGGGVRWLRNTTEPIGHSVAVRYRGIEDNATGRVNHYAIGSTVELWSGDRYAAAIVQDRTTRFGLGDRTEAQTLRAVFPNGTTQHVIHPTLDTVLNEIQILKGSCPYLYAWNGETYEFVTDCLWGAPLGLQVAPGKVIKDRPWEFLLVPGRNIRARDGHYELAITEELWEITYLDSVALTAVDHPPGVEVYTNEKVGPPQIAQEKLYTFDQLRPVRAATDMYGSDVREAISEIDENYASGFQERLRQGLTPVHWIELDVGDVKADDRVVLVLTGWVRPTDSSLNIQISQNPDLTPVAPPSVWVPDGETWREAIPFMGFPGGKTKTMVVDLTGVVRADDPRVRIQASGEFFWDRVKVAVNPPEVEVRTQEAPLVDAELRWHGFGELLPGTERQPQRFSYDVVQEFSKWPPLEGRFTRFGPVKDLVDSWDDQMVVMGPGDEVRLRFRVPSEPPPDGWVRDFVMHNVGWDKDADLNTLTGQSAQPMPFREMTEYPPALGQHALEEDTTRKNASTLTRKQRFEGFWHRSEPPRNQELFVDSPVGSL